MEISKPIFILGVPRSGTTLLFRALHLDSDNFSSFKLWEILFAPSILQKKSVLFILKWDRKIGSPLKKMSLFLTAKFSKSIDNKHYSRLNLAEEDELLLIHIFSSAFLNFIFPNDTFFNRFTHFERELDEAEKGKIMGFHKSCIQRHMYVFGQGKTFLSKNPTFTSKVPSVQRFFPDSRLIYPQRNPLESISSFCSLAYSLYQSTFKILENPLVDKETQDMVLWYQTIALSKFSDYEHWYTINYSQLSQSLFIIIETLYQFLDYDFSDKMRSIIGKLAKEQITRISKHDYSNYQAQIGPLLEKAEIKMLESSFK